MDNGRRPVVEIGERKPVVEVDDKDGVLRLDEEPIAYGVYRGRLGVETERAIYVLDGCPPSLKVLAGGKTIEIDFGKIVHLCRPR